MAHCGSHSRQLVFFCFKVLNRQEHREGVKRRGTLLSNPCCHFFLNLQILTWCRSRWQRSPSQCQWWHRDAGRGQQTVSHPPTGHNLRPGSALPCQHAERSQPPGCRGSQPPWTEVDKPLSLSTVIASFSQLKVCFKYFSFQQFHFIFRLKIWFKQRFLLCSSKLLATY